MLMDTLNILESQPRFRAESAFCRDFAEDLERQLKRGLRHILREGFPLQLFDPYLQEVRALELHSPTPDLVRELRNFPKLKSVDTEDFTRPSSLRQAE